MRASVWEIPKSFFYFKAPNDLYSVYVFVQYVSVITVFYREITLFEKVLHSTYKKIVLMNMNEDHTENCLRRLKTHSEYTPTSYEKSEKMYE